MAGSVSTSIKQDIESRANRQKARHSQRFFKTGHRCPERCFAMP